MHAIELEHVDKIHPLRSGRARSVKHALLSLFRGRAPRETVAALRDVSLTVPAGKSLGILGANGAGKTSLLRLIAGITEPTRGRVHVSGRVLPMLELGAGFHPELTGYENIFLQGILVGVSRERVEKMVPSIIEFAEIENFIHMPVQHYSSGMYLRLGFAISAHMDPDVLLIDEAFSVGDLYFQEKCFRKIQEFQREGRTILLVTHDIGVVERFCDEVIWIDKGCIAAQGTPAEVAHRYRSATFAASFPAPVLPASGKTVYAGWVRYGTGAVTFDYLDFLDRDGNHCTAFENGRPMEIRLRYHVHGSLPETDCLIVIQSYRGHGSAAIATREMGRPIGLRPEGGEIAFRIERLDLAPGRHQLSALLFKGGSSELRDFYDFHLRLYDFYVTPCEGLSEIAALELPCRWEHRSGV